MPKLIGGYNALSKLILTGKTHNGYSAKKLGIVDDVVPIRQLKRAAAYFINKKPSKHRAKFTEKLTNLSWSRQILSNLMRKYVQQKARSEHYPAPYYAIKLWENNTKPEDKQYLQEADSIKKLITKNDTAKNLTRLFLIRERIKSFAKESKDKVKNVHIIGAGVMGGDIAAWCALHDLNVTLQDQDYGKIAPAIARGL